MVLIWLVFSFFSYGVMAEPSHKDCEPLKREVDHNLALFLEVEQRLKQSQETLQNSPEGSSEEESFLIVHKNLVLFLYTEKQLKEAEQSLNISQKAYQECLAT